MRKITFYKCGHKRMGIASLSVPNFINLRHYCTPLKSVNTGDIRTYLHTVSQYFYNHHQAFLQFLFENVGIIPTLIPSGFINVEHFKISQNSVFTPPNNNSILLLFLSSEDQLKHLSSPISVQNFQFRLKLRFKYRKSIQLI